MMRLLLCLLTLTSLERRVASSNISSITSSNISRVSVIIERPSSGCPVDHYEQNVTTATLGRFPICVRCAPGKSTHGLTGQSKCSCEANKYQVTAQSGQVQCVPCPPGLVCQEDGFVPLVAQSEWTQDTTGRYELQQCPSGHRMSAIHHDLQECQPCGSAKYISSAFTSVPNAACNDCPKSLVCENGQLPPSLEGAVGDQWELDNGILKLVSCARGALVVNETVEGQRCEPCRAGTYSLNSLDGCSGGQCLQRDCPSCPIGARCNGPSFESAVEGAVWETVYDQSVGHELIRIASCPAGYARIRLPAQPELDQCLWCPSGTVFQFESTEAASAACNPPDMSSAPDAARAGIFSRAATAVLTGVIAAVAASRGSVVVDAGLLLGSRRPLFWATMCLFAAGAAARSISEKPAAAECPVDFFELDVPTAGGAVQLCVECEIGADTRGRAGQRECECKEGRYRVNGTSSEGGWCAPCPQGLECSADGGLVPRTNGSLWARSTESGPLLLLACPVGHRMRAEHHDLQRCERCPPGWFVFSSADPEDFCQLCPTDVDLTCANRGPPSGFDDRAELQRFVADLREEMKDATADDSDASDSE